MYMQNQGSKYFDMIDTDWNAYDVVSSLNPLYIREISFSRILSLLSGLLFVILCPYYCCFIIFTANRVRLDSFPRHYKLCKTLVLLVTDAMFLRPLYLQYWEKAEFPFQIIPKLASLSVAGGTIKVCLIFDLGASRLRNVDACA